MSNKENSDIKTKQNKENPNIVAMIQKETEGKLSHQTDSRSVAQLTRTGKDRK